MNHKVCFRRLLPYRLAVMLFVPLVVLSARTSNAGGLSGFIGGVAEAYNAQADEERKQRVQRALLEYQFKLEMERLERAAQLENQRLERAHQLERERLAQERAEQERRQVAIRQQQQAAEEKKQQEAAEQKRKATFTGTGFFVAPGGYLVTNNHVIEDTTDYAVRDQKGRFYKATVVARDAGRDLALLKVDGVFPTLKIVSSESVSKGQRVLAVGYPQISIQGNESKVTDGIISSFSGVRNDENWFQISVPIQGGNSGGPLVTESGGVVGVVVATANVARFYKMTGNFPQNVNYAIKSKVLLEFLKSQNLQNVTAAKGKTNVDAVDASTVMVIAKNGAIDVAYTASPEQLAREKRDREMAAANEAKRLKEETLAEQRRQAEERRAEKQRVADSTVLSKRDQAVLKAFPDWQETKDSSIFVAWLAEQKQETNDKLNSPKATDVIAVIRQYHAELPKFANRYAAGTQRLQAQAANVVPATMGKVAATSGMLPLPVQQPMPVVKDCEVCPEMVTIPAGSFEMGSDSGSANERPGHRVNVNRFMLGRTEVTQGQWKAVMGHNPSRLSECGDECPVDRVDWNDAQSYVRKLSEHTGKLYRLPTEAEWEYAGRAGGSTKWSFGDDVSQIDLHGWNGSNSSNRTHPVGQKLANAFNLYDMYGNVWEWVQDVYHTTYAGAPEDGSAWSIGGQQGQHVLRGGSWFVSPEVMRSTARSSGGSIARSIDVGFRVARVP